MADVDIEVNSSDLKAAIDLLNEYGMSFTGMVNKVQTESNRLARASKATTDQITEAWNNAEAAIDNKKLQQVAAEEARILKLRQQNWKQFFQDYGKTPSASSAGAPSSAANSALLQNEKQLAEAMQETARAAKEKERDIASLTAKYNPLLAAEQAYARMQEEVNRATQMGIINTKQQTAALDQLQKEFTALNAGVYLAGSRFNQFGEMSGVAGKSANRFGMYAQQAGYQIGDFAVQLQSGANAGVAFSQQAAQLAGLIPGLAGALTTFAAIGIGLWIQMTTRLNEEGKKTGEIYEDLGSTLDKLSDIRLDNVGSEFSAHATTIKQEFEAILGIMEQMELKSLKATLDQPLEAIRKQVGAAQGISGVNQQIGGEAFTEVDILGLDTVERVAQAYDHLRQIQGESKEEIAASLEYQTRLLRGSGLLTTEVQNILNTMAEQVGVTDIIGENMKEIADAAEEKARIQERDLATALEMRAEMEDQKRIAALTLLHGKDSVQVKQAELAIEYQKLKASIDALDISEDLRSSMDSVADANYAAESATLAWADAMAAVNRQLSGAIGLLNSIGGGMIQSAGISAANRVLDEGGRAVEAERARRRAEEDARLYQEQDRLMAEGKSSPAILAMEQAALDRQRAAEDEYGARIDAARESEREAAKAARGGGGKSKKPKLSDAEKEAEKAQEKLEDFFKQYNLNIKQQERLLGVQGEQREELEKVIEIENRLGDARTLVSEKQIEAMAREELALERKLETERAIYDIGYQNVENLLMTIVNGTASIEDAFKAMLASIISDIYKKFVAEGAADLAGNFALSLFSAKGNAFGVGGVKMFAKGGVVDSPTMFGYGGGKSGMMGEAGPEAIMPLKRNSQGQLGVEVSGGGNAPIHVTNVFQMSANGDAAVKAIIQSEMPKIAETTKRAVIDANRRSQKGFR